MTSTNSENCVNSEGTLMPNARFEMIRGAEQVIWSTHANELRSLLRDFVGQSF
jgi:hypothetical protein